MSGRKTLGTVLILLGILLLVAKWAWIGEETALYFLTKHRSILLTALWPLVIILVGSSLLVTNERGKKAVGWLALLVAIGAIFVSILPLFGPAGPAIEAQEYDFEVPYLHHGKSEVIINQGIGTLAIGTKELDRYLLKGHSRSLTRPVLTKSSDGNQIVLKIDTELEDWGSWKSWTRSKELRTTVYLKKEAPLSLKVNERYGKCEINLESSRVVDLNIKGGAGEIRVRSSGNKHLKGINIEGGLGEIELEAIQDRELRQVKIHGGAGRILADLAESPGLEAVDIERGVGEVTVYLPSNQYTNVRVKGGVGETTIWVPHDVQVKHKSEKGLGSFDIDPRLLDEAENLIYLDVEMGIGSVSVRQY